MIELVLNSINLVLTVIILIILLATDTEISKLRKAVEVKKLRLNERAIDMQMNNTEAYINSLSVETEEVKEEEKPKNSTIGFNKNK